MRGRAGVVVVVVVIVVVVVTRVHGNTGAGGVHVEGGTAEEADVVVGRVAGGASGSEGVVGASLTGSVPEIVA